MDNIICPIEYMLAEELNHLLSHRVDYTQDECRPYDADNSRTDCLRAVSRLRAWRDHRRFEYY